ncbi:MAG: hypothetical protein M9921_04580 [Fimbriimonadaceae bacterium]|nr:hypothetical protein [Chthonomonadaceae bacterium]MCO5296112.1 hypothetical protein [Fimbriimonadaceae bacterium]
MFALLAVAAIAQADALLDFAIPRWQARQETRIEDAYKWLFQATRGGEHAVADDLGPRRWLDQEWRTLGRARPREEEVEPLRPDGAVLRIHLRPYRDRGGNREMLLALFVASAKRFDARRGAFEEAWRRLGERLRRTAIGAISRNDWVRVDRETRALGYPALHHSAAYEKACQPAYRVILGELWLPPASADR